MMRRAALVVGIAACAVLAGSGRADAFVLRSLNTLHLGWGTDKCQQQSTKNDYLVDKMVATAPDVIVLQEVMPKLGSLQALWPGNAATYTVYQSGSQGHSSYRETYGIAVKNGGAVNVFPSSVNNGSPTCAPGAGISRPPCGILVVENTTGTWVLDYHAMFGNKTAREAEVRKIPAAVNWFQNLAVATSSTTSLTQQRVVVGGDWNFSGTELSPMLANTTVEVDTQTSLTPAGLLSSNYDHFWCVGGATCAKVGQDGTIDPPPAPWSQKPSYRGCFSDHLGVAVTVT